jgi:hypothetical protein
MAGRLVIVEDTASDMGLIQLLKEEPRFAVIGRKPDADKETRMSSQQGRFEAGRILLPKQVPWLADFENAVLVFPAVDTMTRSTRCCCFSSGLPRMNAIPQPITFCPPTIVRRGASRRWDARRTTTGQCGLKADPSGFSRHAGQPGGNRRGGRPPSLIRSSCFDLIR